MEFCRHCGLGLYFTFVACAGVTFYVWPLERKYIRRSAFAVRLWDFALGAAPKIERRGG